MKRKLACAFLALACLAFAFAGCGTDSYVLNEDTFFLVMTNMQYYPEQYVNKHIEYDCFVYHLTDVEGNVHVCGVRKCSAEYGCQCGNDTVIGFLLEYDGDIPQPINQSEDTNDKAWIHVTGTIPSAQKTDIRIHAYTESGEIDESTVETISFLTFTASSIAEIEDYSGLHYYVTK